MCAVNSANAPRFQVAMLHASQYFPPIIFTRLIDHLESLDGLSISALVPPLANLTIHLAWTKQNCVSYQRNEHNHECIVGCCGSRKVIWKEYLFSSTSYSCGLPAVMNENDSKHKPEQHKIMNRCLVLSISNWRHKPVTITRVVVYIISSLPFTFENTRCKYVVEETNPDINRQFETA